MADNASRDQNNVPTLLGASTADGISPVRLYANPTTHRLLVDVTAGGAVIGPSSSTDNAIVRWDGTTGKLVKDSAVIVANTTGSTTWSNSGATLLVRTATDISRGSIQLANHNSIAGGIAFGSTVSLFKDGGTGQLSLDTDQSSSGLAFRFNNAQRASLNVTTGTSTVGFGSDFSGWQTIIKSGASTTALTLDSSQSATLAQSLTVSNGSAAQYAVQVNFPSANGGIRLSRTGTSAGNTSLQVTTGGGSQLASDSDFSFAPGNTPNTLLGVASGAVANTIVLKNGNSLFGTSTDSSNGRIQLVSHTTAAGGIGFGTDTNLYRAQQGRIQTDGSLAAGEIGFMAQNSSSAGYATFRFANTGASGRTFSFGSGGSTATPSKLQSKFYIYDNTATQVMCAADAPNGWVFYTNGENTALTIDGSQKSTFAGNVSMTLAKPLTIPSGTNGRAGNAVLVAGTVTVSNTSVTANTIVMLTRKTSGGTVGNVITYTVSAGTSFTINSDNALDTSTFSYLLIETA